MARLFISQDRLDAWSVEQRVSIDGNVMTLADDGRSFRIRPAVRFLRISGPGDDEADLLDRVKSDTELVEMGADHYLEAVIVGEVAYDVQSGFLGDPLPRTGS